MDEGARHEMMGIFVEEHRLAVERILAAVADAARRERHRSAGARLVEACDPGIADQLADRAGGIEHVDGEAVGPVDGFVGYLAQRAHRLVESLEVAGIFAQPLGPVGRIDREMRRARFVPVLRVREAGGRQEKQQCEQLANHDVPPGSCRDPIGPRAAWEPLQLPFFFFLSSFSISPSGSLTKGWSLAAAAASWPASI